MKRTNRPRRRRRRAKNDNRRKRTSRSKRDLRRLVRRRRKHYCRKRRYSDTEDIAARWLIEQDGEAFPAKRVDALVEWLSQSRKHLRDYVGLVRTWRWTMAVLSDPEKITYPPGTDREPKLTANSSKRTLH